MREAVAIQMTWVGAPTIYYGDEAGVCGFTDPDNRRTYPWGNENQELLNFHKEMIRIHKEHPALRTGSLNILSWDENVLAYGRFLGEDRIVAIINNRSEAYRGHGSGMAGGSADEMPDEKADLFLFRRLHDRKD